MTTDTDTLHRVFNEVLQLWRKQGRRIGWEELGEAYRLAQEVEAQGPPPPKEDR